MKKFERDGCRVRGPEREAAAKVALAGLLLLSFTLASYGQSGLPRRTWGCSASGLFPTGDFSRHAGKNSPGVGLFYGWRISRSPMLFGIEADAQFNGVAFFRGESDSYNTVMQGLAFLRLQPRSGAIITYVEVVAGCNYLSTETVYAGDYDDTDSSTIEIQDITLAAGAGAGLCVKLRQDAADPGKEGRPTYLEFKVRYVAGGHANYMRELADGTLVPEHSATSFITAQIGLSWFF
jgi:hypothetical protein